MSIPHNIDKSAFRRGEYVGYSHDVHRIRKTKSKFGNWLCEGYNFATLRDVSRWLDEHEAIIKRMDATLAD